MKKIFNYITLILILSIGIGICCQQKDLQIQQTIQRLSSRGRRGGSISAAQVQTVTNNVVNTASTISANTNLSTSSQNTLTQSLLTNAPTSVLTSQTAMNNVATNVVNASNNASASGFNNLSVTSVAPSNDNNGVSITLQQISSSGSYTSIVDTSSTNPQSTVVTSRSTSQSTAQSQNVNVVYQQPVVTRSVTYPRSRGSTLTNSDGTTTTSSNIESLDTVDISYQNNSVSQTSSDTVGVAYATRTSGMPSTVGGSAVVSTVTNNLQTVTIYQCASVSNGTWSGYLYSPSTHQLSSTLTNNLTYSSSNTPVVGRYYNANGIIQFSVTNAVSTISNVSQQSFPIYRCYAVGDGIWYGYAYSPSNGRLATSTNLLNYTGNTPPVVNRYYISNGQVECTVPNMLSSFFNFSNANMLFGSTATVVNSITMSEASSSKTNSPTYASTPTIVTQSTINIVKNNKTISTKVAGGSMQVRQITTTNVTRSNGTVETFTTVGQPIVNMNLTKGNVKRLTVDGKIVQATSLQFIRTENNKNVYSINGVQKSYNTSSISGSITQTEVYIMNGIASTVQVQSGDQTGSVNACYYFVNGQNTNVIANMDVMQSVTLSGDGQVLQGKRIETKMIDGVNKYVVDSVETDYVVGQKETIRNIYKPIDDIAQNEKATPTISTDTVKRSDGSTVLTSNNLGKVAVYTITLSNNRGTITGQQIVKKQVQKITYGDYIYYGQIISSSNGNLTIDGQITDIPVNDSTVTNQSVYLYAVDGQITNYQVNNSNDVTNLKIYYTDNGNISNVQAFDTDIISKTSSNLTPSNLITTKIYTVTDSNGKSYTTNKKISTSNLGVTIRNTDGTLITSGNTIQTEVKTALYKNGNFIGFNQNATRKNIVTNGYKIATATQQINSFKEIDDLTCTSYYLPKMSGCYFVADGKLMLNNLNGSVSRSDSSRSDYIMIQQPFYVTTGKMVGRFSDYDNCTNPSSCSRDVQYCYSNINNVKIFNCAFGQDLGYYSDYSRQMHCISCGNGIGYNWVDAVAQQPVFGGRGIKIESDGRAYKFYSSTLLDYDTDWSQVVRVSNTYYAMLKKDGSIYIVDYYGYYYDSTDKRYKNTFRSKFQLDLGGTSVYEGINVDLGNRKIISSTSGNGYVYVIDVTNHLLRLNFKNGFDDFVIDDFYDFGTVTDVYCGPNRFVAVTSDKKIFVGKHDSDSATVYENKSNFNIKAVGICRDQAIFAYKYDDNSVTDYVEVTINGTTYKQSQLTTQQKTFYVVNGSVTNIQYNSNYVETKNDLQYSFTDTDNVVRNIPKNQLSSINYQEVSKTVSGSVAAIIKTYTDDNNNVKYSINGKKTDILFDISDTISTSSQQVYYIGDVVTSIKTQTSGSNIQLQGAYWVINGTNTNTVFYGNKEMCMQVKDIMSQQSTQNQDQTQSKIVIPLIIKAQIVRFDQSKPITSIRLQYRKLTDNQWTNLAVLTNDNRTLQTSRIQSIFGRYVYIPVDVSQSFILRCNISDGTTSTVTASNLNIQQGNPYYWAFIRNNAFRPKRRIIKNSR